MDFFIEEEIFGTDASHIKGEVDLLDDLKFDYESEDDDLDVDDETDLTTLLD